MLQLSEFYDGRVQIQLVQRGSSLSIGICAMCSVSIYPNLPVARYSLLLQRIALEPKPPYNLLFVIRDEALALGSRTGTTDSFFAYRLFQHQGNHAYNCDLISFHGITGGIVRFVDRRRHGLFFQLS
jgi:hypothetical protein